MASRSSEIRRSDPLPLKYLTHKVITNRSYTFKTRLLESAVLREVKNGFFMTCKL
jgi:hypothetical protein